MTEYSTFTAPSPASCPHGHPVRPGAAFCSVCGAPVAVAVPDATAPAGALPSASATLESSPFGYAPQPAALPPAFTPDATWTTFTPARRPRRRRIALAVSATLAIAAAAITTVLLVGTSNGPARTTVTGQFLLSDVDTADSNCIGQGGYSDIATGVSVILTNETGKILGSTSLGDGTADQNAGTCQYTFSIPGVPEDQAQYAIEISHRGKVVHNRADMQTAHWTFQLSLGD